jgi:hypothetical protein
MAFSATSAIQRFRCREISPAPRRPSVGPIVPLPDAAGRRRRSPNVVAELTAHDGSPAALRRNRKNVLPRIGAMTAHACSARAAQRDSTSRSGGRRKVSIVALPERAAGTMGHRSSPRLPRASFEPPLPSRRPIGLLDAPASHAVSVRGRAKQPNSHSVHRGVGNRDAKSTTTPYSRATRARLDPIVAGAIVAPTARARPRIHNAPGSIASHARHANRPPPSAARGRK